MRLRELVCTALLTCASSLAAQTSISISSSVPDDRFDYYLIEVDQGTTPTAVDVTVDLTTTGVSGLYSDLYDVDQWALDAYPRDSYEYTTGPGSVIYTLSLPSRTDVHQLMLYVSTDDDGPASDYSGTVSVSAGTIAQVDFQTHTHFFTGTRNYFDRYIPSTHLIDGTGKIYLDVELDFGSTAHPTTFYVEAGANGASMFELQDATATPVSLYQVLPNSAGQIIDIRAFTTPSYSGVVRFRFEFTKADVFGVAGTVLVVGPDVTVVSVTDPFTDAQIPAPRSSSSRQTGCTSGINSGRGGAVFVTLLVAGAILCRRVRVRSAVSTR